jgi:predicted glycogen debranching enzyme
VASDSYLFRRESEDGAKDSVIAGYPWFGDWGRDTMIALPGLTLATGRPALAKAILETFSGYVQDGLLPNVFPGSGETPEYNTVDAALWFIEAWRAYVEASDDFATLKRAFPALVRIIAAYRQGTRFGIGVDAQDGLVRAGEPGQQLTWMDARVDGQVITPRHGKPVEINALWYNALRSMADFARRIGVPAAQFDALADAAQAGFARFDRGDGGGLFDVLDGPDGNDASIRPNQIFALSLTHSPVTETDIRERVLKECREHLLTPVGLRSLSPEDDRYQGEYLGGVAERDGSYHQGPVWTWLLGHFALAEFQVTGDPERALRHLESLSDQLSEACVGQLSEIHDGDAPHLARGAPAQAWSVACTLEAWWRIERSRQG